MSDYLTSEASPRIVSTGQAFSIGALHYGAEWLGIAQASDLLAAGLRLVVYVGQAGDPRYYTPSQSAPILGGGVATITWINTPLALAVVKAAKLQDLNTYALLQDSSGTPFGGFQVFTTDHYKILYAMANQRALAGGLTTLNLPDAAGVFHALTATQIENLYNAVVIHVAAVLANQNTHQTNISALSDSPSVINYDFTTGWPV